MSKYRRDGMEFAKRFSACGPAGYPRWRLILGLGLRLLVVHGLVEDGKSPTQLDSLDCIPFSEKKGYTL